VAEPAFDPAAGVRVGSSIELDVGPVAHGGHCVARHLGQVVFVRHAIPGERVVARVTDGGEGSRFLRADAVEVRLPSPDRVEVRCGVAGPGGCGGCDFQHVTVARQRQLKADVVSEQFRRLAGLTVDVPVEAVAGDVGGLGWRTRAHFAVDADGRAGLRRHRSHEVVPIESCPISHPLIEATGVLRRTWPGVADLRVAVAPASGRSTVLVDGEPDPGRAGSSTRLVERAAGRDWRVSGDGFWQVHPGAADVLVETAIQALRPSEGEHLLDLYAGVGLFAGAFAPSLGAAGRVDAVEADPGALRDARRNLHDLATVRLVEAPVRGWLRTKAVTRADLVLLDPPRAGAGAAVVSRIAELSPRAICYVACDPAALARDVATLAGLGWRLEGLRAFDLFPMTHHVECVATLVPAASSSCARQEFR
jgi:tRNA/tmRNA/rRNA uracil-C5-methylase (TrmA/RlmC/RlmD family)